MSELRIEVDHNESRTKWFFKVYDAFDRVVAQGAGFGTGILARLAAMTFLKYYVPE